MNSHHIDHKSSAVEGGEIITMASREHVESDTRFVLPGGLDVSVQVKNRQATVDFHPQEHSCLLDQGKKRSSSSLWSDSTDTREVSTINDHDNQLSSSMTSLTTVQGQLNANPNFTKAQAKAEAKREYHRQHAALCRSRNKNLVNKLRMKVDDLYDLNRRLKERIESLETENAELKVKNYALQSQKGSQMETMPHEHDRPLSLPPQPRESATSTQILDPRFATVPSLLSIGQILSHQSAVPSRHPNTTTLLPHVSFLTMSHSELLVNAIRERQAIATQSRDSRQRDDQINQLWRLLQEPDSASLRSRNGN